MQKISVTLDTGGVAVPGIDYGALVADIQAEMDKLGAGASAKAAKKTIAAPTGAQGGFESIHWILEFAADPKMAAVYARALIFAVNQLLNVAESKKKEKSSLKPPKDPGEPPVKIKALGKEIMLPATAAAIQEFLKMLGEH